MKITILFPFINVNEIIIISQRDPHHFHMFWARASCLSWSLSSPGGTPSVVTYQTPTRHVWHLDKNWNSITQLLENLCKIQHETHPLTISDFSLPEKEFVSTLVEVQSTQTRTKQFNT